MLVPDRQRCNCALELWEDYAICKSSLAVASRALSFGIFGFDPWAEHVHRMTNVIPELFDCFNSKRPEFKNNFSALCLAASAFTDSSGRRFETLSRILEGSNNESVLVKLDIEHAEY